MTNNYTDALEKAFKEECKVIDLQKEYMHYKENIRWAIAMDISEEEIRQKYSAVLKQYEPFILLTKAQYMVMRDFHSNNRKHNKRNAKLGDVFNYEDGRLEKYHPEMLNQIFNDDFQNLLWLEETVSKLTESHRERLEKHFAEEMTYVEIAEEEGVSPQAVQQSIARAITALKKNIPNS